MSRKPTSTKLTNAEKQARHRERREAREQAKDAALCRILTSARTIREAREIAAEALGERNVSDG